MKGSKKRGLQTIGLASLLLAVMAMTTATLWADEAPTETKEQRDARMAWWRGARFGMFIHWGLYAVPAGTYKGKQIPGIGEWIMNNASIPVATYAEYAKQFNPTKFNAEQWVSIAKDAGMKYMVITSKHHDGFAMFHTRVDDYNIYDATPFKRDPLAELSEAANKQHMKLGFYYSQSQDWHHPGGAAIVHGGRTVAHWDKAQDGDYAEYLKNVAQPQVTEILSNYGNVAVLWFDTPTDAMTKELASPFVDILRNLQPQIIWNNRLGGGFQGDTETPEQFIPPTGFPGRDWETCMTMNDTWGYKSYDNNFKSVQMLIRNLCDIASKGGNYLLNVGPTAEGVIPQPEVDRLKEIGQWLKTNGEAIYGTNAGPFKHQLSFGRSTAKPGKLYLSVFDAPADGTLWLPMTSNATKAYLLTAPEKRLDIGSRDNGLTIKLAGALPDKNASIVVLELAGEPRVFTPAILADKDHIFALRAADADLAGGAKVSAHRKSGVTTAAVALAATNDAADWPIHVTEDGNYRVEAVFVVGDKMEGSEFTLSAGDQKLSGKVQAAKTGETTSTIKLGDLHLKAGDVIVTVKPSELKNGSLMNLKQINIIKN